MKGPVLHPSGIFVLENRNEKNLWASDSPKPRKEAGQSYILLSREKNDIPKKLSNQKHKHALYFLHFSEKHLAIKPLQPFCGFQRVSHLFGTLHLIVTFIRHAHSGAATHNPLSRL